MLGSPQSSAQVLMGVSFGEQSNDSAIAYMHLMRNTNNMFAVSVLLLFASLKIVVSKIKVSPATKSRLEWRVYSATTRTLTNI